METLMLYLLKMMVCSAVLFGYYRAALYNEKFHQWNRFYLLTSMLLAVIVPLISIPFFVKEETADLLIFVNSLPGNAPIEIVKSGLLTWQNVAFVCIAIVSAFMLLKILVGIVRLINAYYMHPVTSLDDKVRLILTDFKHAPFSFFSWLFWRHDIDPASQTGNRMLTHELAHITQRHSWDKIFTEVLLSLFWMNPFFWLIRRELNTIHEFLADSKAIEKHDGTAFAEMILHAMHLQPAVNNCLVNPFFSSQIKRRLFMITTSSEPRYSYLRRLSGLVIMIFSVVLLSLTIQRVETQQNDRPVKPKESSTALPADKAPATSTVTGKPSPNQKVITIVSDTVRGNIKELFMVGSAGEKVNIQLKASQDQQNEITVIGKEMDKGASGTKITSKDGKEPPLYIVDGKELNGSEIEKLKPSEFSQVSVLKGESAADLYGAKGKNGVIIITSKSNDKVNGLEKKSLEENGQKEIVVKGFSTKDLNPFVYLNGKQIPFVEMEQIKPNDIESINVLKGGKAIEKYGDKATNGVIEITTKKPVG